MKKTKILSNYIMSLRADPIFVVLDSLYYQNPDSSIYQPSTAQTRYSRLLVDLGRILYTDLENTPPASTRDVPFSRIFSIAEMIIFSLANCKDIVAEVMRPAYRGDYFILVHTLNVAVLSCQAAIGLGLSYRELTHVCVVALLHDFGMKFIDLQTINHKGQLTDSQRQEIDCHFDKTLQYFKNLENDFPVLIRVVDEENKRLKHGQNKYIEKVDTDNVEFNKAHTISEVVGMCNKFEALCHDRPYRKAFHPADAMKIFVEENKHKYDRRFIRAIIDSISLYPITSLVRLNNNRIARVIDIVEGCPLSPIVAIISDHGDSIPDEPQLTGEIIDLSQKPTVFIDGLVYTGQYQKSRS